MTATGAAVLVVAVTRVGDGRFEVLAMLAAAVLATELLQVHGDRSSLDPADAHSVSFSAGVHLVAAVEAGPWAAALLAGGGIVVVDTLRGAPRRRVAYNASTIAISALLAGLTFQALGGTVSSLDLPGDFPAVVAAAVVLYAVQVALVSTVVAMSNGDSLRPAAAGAFVFGLPPAAGETGFGIALAVLSQKEPWAIPTLLPLVAGLYLAQKRLTRLRRETADALETLANVIDQRDTSTFHHSTRVADLVEGLANGLRLNPAAVTALRWAGRLHDLGKVSIDSAVLAKPGKLDPAEWEAVRHHPRLSARLLLRYRFAAGIARAVEYHHERFDGNGYFGLPGADVPLASHFLTVADTFDAMTSDRAYRAGVDVETALREIEAGAGTQFHPAVARAFAAYIRGQDPRSVLEPGELAQLGRLSFQPTASRNLCETARRVADRREVTVLPAAVALVAAGLGRWEISAVAAVVALTAMGWHWRDAVRSRRLAAALTAARASTDDPERFVAKVVAIAAGVCKGTRVTLVRRQDGRFVAAATAGEGTVVGDRALESLLLRDGDTEQPVFEARGSDVGSLGALIGVVIDREAGEYIVVAAAARPPRRLRSALANASFAGTRAGHTEPERTEKPQADRLAA